jgi:hypothetical protein
VTSPQQTDSDYDDAYQLLAAKLHEWGIDDLDETSRKILTEGYSPDVALLRLQDTPQYQKRFAANKERLKKGLPVLSPAEYVNTERAYISKAREYGLPEGFYDGQEDFQRWIAADVSPAEFEERASAASKAYINAPQDVKEQWANVYGLTPGDAVAAFLDENKAMDMINRRVAAVNISTEARRAFNDPYAIDQVRAGELADKGVSQQDAQRGFQDVAGRFERDAYLGRLAGEAFTRTEAEDEVLLGDSGAKAERDRIYNAERGRFNENFLGTTSAGVARSGGQF